MENEGKFSSKIANLAFQIERLKPNNIIRRDVEDREIEFARDFNDNVQQHHH